MQEPVNGTRSSSKLLIKSIDDSTDWNNPNGIDNAIKSLLPDPIAIYSMQDANEDVGKLKATNTLGKIIKILSKQIVDDVISSKINDLNKILIGDDETLRQPIFNEFEKSVTQKMDDFFPDLKIKLGLERLQIDDILSKSKLFVSENGIDREFSNLGHGAQRSVQMSLIRQLADYSKKSLIRSQVILIDEPELYLHPQAIELLRESLEVLSKNGFQIIFTTHSPYMIRKEHILGTNIIRKYNNETFVLPRICDSIHSDNSGSMNTLFGIENLAQLLFSDQVLLIEGTTEQIILPSLFEKILNKKLERYKISLINAGGSGAVASLIKILKKMNINYKAVVDLDFAFKVAPNQNYCFIEGNHVSIHACKDLLLKLNSNDNLYLGDDKYPRNGKVKDGEKNITAARGFEILAENLSSKEHIQNIHNDLKKHNIWVWKTGAIESCLCLKHKESGEWHNFRNSILNTDETLSIINEPDEILKFISWVSEVPIFTYIQNSKFSTILRKVA